jgi:hypothetical protein
MLRTISSIVVGLLAWLVIATALNFGLRLWLPGYALAEPRMAFTLGMLIARLVLAAIAGLAAGAVVRQIAPANRAAPWFAGLLLVVLFLPVHVELWHKFPVWYHLTFLLSIVPLVVLGATIRLASGRRELTTD